MSPSFFMRPTHQNCVFISHSGRVGESNFIIKTVSSKSDMAINCMFASKRFHDHPDRLVGETSVFAASRPNHSQLQARKGSRECGLRFSDIATLKWANIDFNAKTSLWRQ